MPDNETARRVSVDYTLAAALVLQEMTDNKIRFVYCSGAAAERDHNKPLWFMQEYRRIRVCLPYQRRNRLGAGDVDRTK